MTENTNQPEQDVQVPEEEAPESETIIIAEADEAAPSFDLEQEGNILTLPVLPLRGTVVFPLTVVPLAAAQPRSLRLIDEVMSGDRTVALVMQKDAELEGAGPDDVYDIGTISTIHQMMRVPDGTVRLAVQGNERMRILEFVEEEPYLVARVQTVPEVIEESVEVDALTRNTLELFQRLVSLVAHMPDELVTAALNVDDPRHLVYLVATNLRMDAEERQHLLELDSVRDKLADAECLHRQGTGRSRAGQEDSERRPGRAGQESARVLPARAAEGDPARAWRRHRDRSRSQPSCGRRSRNPACRKRRPRKPAASSIG